MRPSSIFLHTETGVVRRLSSLMRLKATFGERRRRCHSPLFYDVDDFLVDDGLKFSSEENGLLDGFVDSMKILGLKVIRGTSAPARDKYKSD